VRGWQDESDVPRIRTLEIESVSLQFGAIRALRDASLLVRGGEVHALMGENGAGKSTLLKILSGAYRPDSGRISIDDQRCEFASPAEALRRGISVIYQELQLVPELSVAENLLLGDLPHRSGLVDRRALASAALAQIEALGERFSPDEKVKNLSIGQRQMVEIGKALLRRASVIAFDEPTSSLSAREVDRLSTIINRLREQGRAVIYITHRMEEVARLCDRITVFRDGSNVCTFDDARTAERSEVVRAMVGRDITPSGPHRARTGGDPILEVGGVSGPGVKGPVSLTVRTGEIVGLFGLVGAGRTELLKMIFGATQPRTGQVSLAGARVQFRRPRDAVCAGIAFASEDRKKEGIFPLASVADNMHIVGRRAGRREDLLRNRRQEGQAAMQSIAALSIRPPAPGNRMAHLSGGNQQKVILARWFANQPSLLLLDEPTRGIDVGARADIYGHLKEYARKGGAVLMVSSELPEVLEVADRILVMREGEVSGEIEQAAATPELLMEWALPA